MTERKAVEDIVDRQSGRWLFHNALAKIMMIGMIRKERNVKEKRG
jgi:hypothetical protein